MNNSGSRKNSTPSLCERVIFSGAILLVASGLMGVNACQKDYEFGVKTNVPGTTTPTPSGTDDGLITNTPTSTSTSTATPTNTSTVTPTQTATPVTTKALIMGALTELSKTPEPVLVPSPVSAQAGAGSTTAQAKSGDNWLGNLDNKECTSDSASATADSDNDGFTDSSETATNSDPCDAQSIPAFTPSTRLIDHVKAFEPSKRDEVTQLLNAFYARRGNGNNAAVNNDAFAIDSDNDGAPDIIERALGLDSEMIDTDGDGVTDGKELELGSDPTIPDRQ